MTRKQAEELAVEQGAILLLPMGYGGYIAAYRPSRLDRAGRQIIGMLDKDVDKDGNEVDNRRHWARAILRPGGDGYTLSDWAFCAPPEGV